MRRDIRNMKDELIELCEREARYLYRLAWRMTAHGCKPENIAKCRDEARFLHMCAYPERVFDEFKQWDYAFKI